MRKGVNMSCLLKASVAVILTMGYFPLITQSSSQPKLALSMSPVDHIAAHYVDPSPGLTLAFYFRGDEIKFSVSLFNEGDAPVHLGWGRSDVQKQVSFNFIDLPEDQQEKSLLLVPYELVLRPKDGKLEPVESIARGRIKRCVKKELGGVS